MLHLPLLTGNLLPSLLCDIETTHVFFFVKTIEFLQICLLNRQDVWHVRYSLQQRLLMTDLLKGDGGGCLLMLVRSQCLLWRLVLLLMVGVYSSNCGVLYTIRISITRRFQKSVGLSICNTNKYAYGSFIIYSRIKICILGERAWHLLEENEAIFSKNYFSNFLLNFRKITLLLAISALLVEE